MQKLVWSEKEVEGGKPVDVVLEKAKSEEAVRHGCGPGPDPCKSPGGIETLRFAIRDVAVVAIPLRGSAGGSGLQDRATSTPNPVSA